jgi:hypothetical protein
MVMQPACVISPAGMSSMGKKIGGAQVHLLYYARPFLCAPAAARYSSPRALVEALKSNYTCLIAATIAQLVTTGSAFLK